MKSGNFNFLEHSGTLQASNGTSLPFLCSFPVGTLWLPVSSTVSAVGTVLFTVSAVLYCGGNVPYSLGPLLFAARTTCLVAGNVFLFFFSTEICALCTHFAVGNVCSCTSAVFCLTSARLCEVMLLSSDDESTNYGWHNSYWVITMKVFSCVKHVW